jgi:hypothetical protein
MNDLNSRLAKKLREKINGTVRMIESGLRKLKLRSEKRQNSRNFRMIVDSTLTSEIKTYSFLVELSKDGHPRLVVMVTPCNHFWSSFVDITDPVTVRVNFRDYHARFSVKGNDVERIMKKIEMLKRKEEERYDKDVEEDRRRAECAKQMVVDFGIGNEPGAKNRSKKESVRQADRFGLSIDGGRVFTTSTKGLYDFSIGTMGFLSKDQVMRISKVLGEVENELDSLEKNEE